MILPGPTHSGCPFVGRSREIGILTHLLQEGLEGRLGLIRVAGSTGSGRRRLIAEALNQGPDVEWVHLAPGGAEPDFVRWVRTELIDLLDTYPEAPLPSWALHRLDPWAPTLAERCAIPILARERPPAQDASSVIGHAIGALLLALTGQTSVIVDAGLWPAGTAASRTLAALARALEEPGALVIAASETRGLRADPPSERTLLLEPLDREAVSTLAHAWKIGKESQARASWLHRVTAGHPFFLQEVIRWLEELGHVRVHEEDRRIEPLTPLERWPYPLHLEAVMETRYRRLSPAATQLLELIAREDGRVEVEALRARWDDDETFEESMAWLRRRDFLRDRSTRRPLVLASPLWRSFARARITPFHKPEAVFLPEAPLARLLDLVDQRLAAAGTPDPDALSRDVTEIARRLRGRRGPAWDGVRGRLAVLAARLRVSQARTARALLWIRWGLARTSPEIHPGLRRALRALAAECMETGMDAREAATYRRDALDESVECGHLLAAHRLRSVLAEESRRLGKLDVPALHPELRQMGLESHARLAAFTRIAAFLDARDLESAREALPTNDPASQGPLSAWLARLEAASEPSTFESKSLPRGWKWGLDGASSWRAVLEGMEKVLSDQGNETDVAPAQLQSMAEESGFLVLASDLAEHRISRRLRTGVPMGASPSRKSTDDLLGHLLIQTAALLEKIDAPHRWQDVADRFVGTEAAEHPRFPELFGAHLVRGESDRSPETRPGVVLVCTGAPRVQRGGRTWPGSLWPKWWAELWGCVVSTALLEERLDAPALLNHLQLRGHPPVGDLQDLISMANDLFRGPKRSAGGLVMRQGDIGFEWSGVFCDARAALQAFDAANVEADPIRARWLRAQGLDLIEGRYLPGLDAPPVLRVRRRLHDAITSALETALLYPDLSASRFARWLEGPVRAVSGFELAARVMESRGRPQLALALRRVLT